MAPYRGSRFRRACNEARDGSEGEVWSVGPGASGRMACFSPVTLFRGERLSNQLSNKRKVVMTETWVSEILKRNPPRVRGRLISVIASPANQQRLASEGSTGNLKGEVSHYRTNPVGATIRISLMADHSFRAYREPAIAPRSCMLD
jgi:hypothetical protein